MGMSTSNEPFAWFNIEKNQQEKDLLPLQEEESQNADETTTEQQLDIQYNNSSASTIGGKIFVPYCRCRETLKHDLIDFMDPERPKHEAAHSMYLVCFYL